jgi:dephospho-CoA kinase
MIIGITGTDGAGKGAVVDYLVKEKGFVHFSVRAEIEKEIVARGLTLSRDTTRLVSNDMRRVEGLDVHVVRAIKAIDEREISDAVIESVRALAEAETLMQEGGILLAIDADEKIRYERITGRGSITDQITFERFKEQEAIEMNDPDPNGMQKAKVMAMADYTIMNNGSLPELHQNIETFLQTVMLGE